MSLTSLSPYSATNDYPPHSTWFYWLTQSFQLCSQKISKSLSAPSFCHMHQVNKDRSGFKPPQILGTLLHVQVYFLTGKVRTSLTFYVHRWSSRHSICEFCRPYSQWLLYTFNTHLKPPILSSLIPQEVTFLSMFLKKWLPPNTSILFKLVTTQILKTTAWQMLYVLEQKMATHSSILTGKFHGQRSLAGCSPWGLKESDMGMHVCSKQMYCLSGKKIPI